MFITFEGIEGCGKTTQLGYLAERLKIRRIPFVRTLEPGGTRLGQEIRRILLDSRNRSMAALAELLLYEADRMQHVEEVIRPALEADKWVLCDRFYDATTVYQGYARGQDLTLVELLNAKVSGGIRPHLTFLLDCPVTVGLERAFRRNRALQQVGQDRFEREDVAFHNAVREGYLVLSRKEHERFVVVDATQPEASLANEIFERVSPFMRHSAG